MEGYWHEQCLRLPGEALGKVQEQGSSFQPLELSWDICNSQHRMVLVFNMQVRSSFDLQTGIEKGEEEERNGVSNQKFSVLCELSRKGASLVNAIFAACSFATVF